MGKGWPKAFSHPFSVCSLSLSFSPSLYLFLRPFSIIHTLVSTHACSKPPDILSPDTTPGLSGCSLTILPPYSSISISPSSVLRLDQLSSDTQRGGDKQQEQVTYLSCNQTYPSKLCVFQSAVNHISTSIPYPYLLCHFVNHINFSHSFAASPDRFKLIMLAQKKSWWRR